MKLEVVFRGTAWRLFNKNGYLKTIIIIILIILTNSCGVIKINENNYSLLSKRQIIELSHFESYKIDEIFKPTDTVKLIETNATDIIKILKHYDLVFIHFWKPFCSNESCQSLEYLNQLNNGLDSKNSRIILISETYDIDDIVRIVKASNYKEPIFIINDLVYGHKIRKATLKFQRELIPKSISIYRFGFEDLIFKKNELIYYDTDLDLNKVEKILKNSSQ